MKIAATLLSATTLALSSLAFAFESDEQRDAILLQLGETPTEETYQNVLIENAEFAIDILAILLSLKGVDPQFAVQAAMTAAPDSALEIAQLARDIGVSNENITTAALLAGLDPTAIAEATAAGIQTATAGPAPPSAPTVGGQGGGGTGVISPN
ncbi:hypothetical protein [Enterovibrio nigricans]|uniref:Uncharacterized protein n=1 Tax=Enterovibrio nigricans DSM 22720 TaxID=1121868 RepID=A0A1T4US33_9GAMM|nr:hypothetical protein [Enterovibrio nigricans]SKA55465.1 hypothetical protein SAMN02745132_02344 [Enterovibrio nigricans DSM 22720]